MSFFRNQPRRRRVYALALFLLLAGAIGILCSPSVGVVRGKQIRSFEIQKVKELPSTTIIEVSQFDLPTVRNGRGLLWMSLMMFASVGSIFAGVYLFSFARRDAR